MFGSSSTLRRKQCRNSQEADTTSWSMRRLLGPRSQVCQSTTATVMLCKKPPQNSVAKGNTPLPYSSRGQLCFILQVCVSEPLPWLFPPAELEGLLGHIQDDSRGTRGKKRYSEPLKALTENWHYHYQPYFMDQSKRPSPMSQGGKCILPVMEPWWWCSRKRQRTWANHLVNYHPSPWLLYSYPSNVKNIPIATERHPQLWNQAQHSGLHDFYMVQVWTAPVNLKQEFLASLLPHPHNRQR